MVDIGNGRQAVSNGKWGCIGITIPLEFRHHSIQELEDCMNANNANETMMRIDPETYAIWIKKLKRY